MKKTTLLGGLIALGLAIICIFCSVPHKSIRGMESAWLRPLDMWAADTLYTVNEYSGDNRIKIIKIDEKTEAELGNFKSWGRDIPAQLIEYLNAPERKPAVIGFDISFANERLDALGDDELAAAAKENGNVVIASQPVFRNGTEKQDDGTIVSNALIIESYEYPYRALREVTTNGFVTALQDSDQEVRMAMLKLTYEGKTIYNFGYEVYRQYQEQVGDSLYQPLIDGNSIFGIHYIAGNDGYETFSWTDVVNGVYADDVFKDCIVLVGAYMSGMQDQMKTPIATVTMNGVEIHANVIDSMLREQSFSMVNYSTVAWISFGLCVGFFLVLLLGNLWITLLVGLIGSGTYLFVAKQLYENGKYIYPGTFVVAIILMVIANIGYHYIAEAVSKRQMIREFKKYVAPQVLDQMTKNGDFSVKLGGEAKDVAILFVDIRGFTTLSESLEPEQVVEMLNEYLALTTEAIFANGGTLDKFIGDATMAIFNAPFDLPDYEACAVQTALDIVKGAEKVNVKIKEKIGREVAFGVGVNCGKAVIGNIGSDNRMDYTAIGDTVNTASRLEGKAKGGQVVISPEVKKRLGDRIVTNPLGEMSLKGKAEPITVYEVLGFAQKEEN